MCNDKSKPEFDRVWFVFLAVLTLLVMLILGGMQGTRFC